MNTILIIILALFATIGLVVVATFVTGYALGWDKDEDCECEDCLNDDEAFLNFLMKTYEKEIEEIKKPTKRVVKKSGKGLTKKK